MRILVCPDSFKGSLSAPAAADAIARGTLAAARDAGDPAPEIDRCPLSDGGDGLIDALTAASIGRARTTRTTDPLGRPINARWLLLDQPTSASLFARLSYGLAIILHTPAAVFLRPILFLLPDRKKIPGRTAIIESAQAVGLTLLAENERDPMRAHSGGLAHLILDANEHLPSRIVIGLGGSATVDGGIGLANALGAAFQDDHGRRLRPEPGALAELAAVSFDPREALKGIPPIVAACDVTNPLLGPDGAARTFGPQKGATPEQVEALEEVHRRLADACRDIGLPADPDAHGSGAAGGLGFALAAFAGATLVPGTDIVFDLVRLRERMAAADLVITGEGRLDEQSSRGKVVGEVARIAAELGVPCIAAVGQCTADPAEPADQFQLRAVLRIIDLADDEQDAITNAADYLQSLGPELWSIARATSA